MKKNLTEIVFILDRSGSMSGLEADMPLLSLGLSAVIPVLPGFPAQQPATACFIRSQLSTFRQSYHSILLGASSKPVPSSKRTLPPVTARGVS